MKIKFILSITICLLLSISLHSQCYINKNDAESQIKTLKGPYNLVGKWSVGVRGTLFYNDSVLLSDFRDYPVDWYVLPNDRGYQFCLDENDKDKGIVKGVLLTDAGIENQYFFFGYNESGEEQVSIAKHLSEDILIFHYKASDDYVRKNYTDSVQEGKIEDVHLLWEYVLTRT